MHLCMQGLPALRSLQLNKNAITFIEASTFGSLPRLSVLDVTYNILLCSPHFKPKGGVTMDWDECLCPKLIGTKAAQKLVSRCHLHFFIFSFFTKAAQKLVSRCHLFLFNECLGSCGPDRQGCAV